MARLARGSATDLASSLLAEVLDDVEIGRVLQPRTDGTQPTRAVVLVAMSPPASVDANLLHELVDVLYERGWAGVTVAGRLRACDRDRGYDELPALARQAGYLGLTGRANRYDLVDLDELSVPAPVPDTSVLAGQPVAQSWVEADLRVTVARNVTDATDGFALGLSLLLAAAPSISGAEPGDVAADLARHLGPELALIDAITSSHGEAGDAVLEELPTNTIAAGTDALLVDVVGAGLQGTDPAASRLCAAALQQNGLPTRYRIDGNVEPFPGWRAADPMVRVMGQDMNPALTRLLAAIQAPGAPGRDDDDRVLTALRAAARPWLTVTQPVQRGLMAGAGSAAETQRQAWATMFAKDRVDRVEVPLGFDLGAYTEADYDAVPEFVESFTRLLGAGPSGTENGLRWRYVGQAVVFEAERTVAAPFELFIERVDVAAGISLMADYIGGRRIAVSRDADGRAIRQGERNVYLAQPNYVAAWGGRPIDVAKIERVDYRDAWHRLSWRTVISPNGSATYDDGMLTLAADGSDRTRLTVRGRQLFTLPPALEALHLELYPVLKDALVEDAYRRFFTATFDNLEACYEGREYRVGRAPAGEDTPLATVALSTYVDIARDWLAEKPLRTRVDERLRRRPSDRAATDADGFQHFVGTPGGSASATRAGGRVGPGRSAWARQAAAELAAAWAADRDRLSAP